ncbi:MAG: glycogen synthase GlgA [Rectinemataceae bacterium]|jgi:starch synthase
MKILMVSSEAAPFAKAGGLGDMVSALSRALSKAGHEVALVLPRYYGIDRSRLELIEGPLGVGKEWASVYKAYLPGSTVETYFLEQERFFGRDGIYGSKAESDFADNPERFAFLCRGAFQLCRKLGWIPDVMHAHDWPTSLVPVFLRHDEKLPEFANTASVLTIHNLGYQGIYPKESFPSFRLPWELFHDGGFEFYDKVNLLKAGIRSADCLTTVSPSYAREIQTPDYGFGLDGLLRHRSSDLVGILNGVDLDEWDPETDLHLPARYSREKMTGKNKCKAVLQKEYGLQPDAGKPLIGMVGRLTDQKGVGELFGPLYGSAYRICAEMDLQFAVVGSGDKWCEDELRALSSRLPNFKAMIGFDERLAHLVEAGSDFFLMPSRYEPCGLNQMYSLRYGTLPIVHRTGGLADTVENYNQETGAGTGFMFDNLTPRAVYDTVGWAVWAWYNRREQIDAMRIRAMGRRFSWDRSAAEYAKLYERALGLSAKRRSMAC